MLLIGICGPKRSGKGRVAQHLKDHASRRGCKVEIRGFSDLVKWSMARLFMPQCTLQQGIMFADELKVRGEVTMSMPGIHHTITGRELVQRYGTEAHREIMDHNFWTDLIIPYGNESQTQENFDHADIGILADMRFDNEARRIHDLGGVNWEVKRAGEELDKHVSEAGVADHLIDETITNYGTLDELTLQAEKVFYEVLSQRESQLALKV